MATAAKTMMRISSTMFLFIYDDLFPLAESKPLCAQTKRLYSIVKHLSNTPNLQAGYLTAKARSGIIAATENRNDAEQEE